jgi:hypothetical protein
MWLNLSMESTPLWLHHKIDKKQMHCCVRGGGNGAARSRNKNHLVRPSGHAGSHITTLINERTVELSAAQHIPENSRKAGHSQKK